MIKYIGLLSILLPLSTSTFCGVISSTYSDDGHKLNTYNYFYKGDVFKRCDQKNDCEDLFNKNKKYCNNILKLKDKDDIQVRIRWECPRYESIKQLEKYNIFLSTDPAFTDYTFNLSKIFTNENKVEKNQRLFDNLNLDVGLSPNNIYIPYDINDVIEKINIRLDDENYVLSEEYEMQDSSKFIRQYVYHNHNISQIIEIKKDANSKIIYSSKHAYVYK